MKILNTRYLVLLLMLCFGSASAHGLIDHDTHGCSACILSSSSKDLLDDLNDSNDGNNDLALIHSESDVFISINKDSIVTANQDLYLHSTQRLYSIRAPPVSLF